MQIGRRVMEGKYCIASILSNLIVVSTCLSASKCNGTIDNSSLANVSTHTISRVPRLYVWFSQLEALHERSPQISEATTFPTSMEYTTLKGCVASGAFGTPKATFIFQHASALN
eukprot:m.80513 g.80513  ORF g.80513 m.80513 type:complete len:114 (+) comp8623_c0_seq4:304-645(+)